MFNQNQKANLIATVIVVSGFTFASDASAAVINFDNWDTFGDVITDDMGGTSMSTNALSNDDSPEPDTNFNFSDSPAIDSIDLGNNLGVDYPPGLDPDPDNFVQAFEGSGLTQNLSFTEATTFSFDFTFQTNDETFTDQGFDFDDYAFFVTNGTVIPIAGTFDSLVTSGSNYQREISGRFSQTFAPGSFDISLGVVDVGDFNESSALIVSNAQTNPSSAKVPESSLNWGFLGLGLWAGISQLKRNYNSRG